MSTTSSSMNEPMDRPPLKEIAKRVAEAGSGLVAATRAAAVKNFVANQEAHRKRLWDGHAAGMRQLGLEATPLEQELDDVGDIIVTGDIYSDRAVDALKGNTPTPTGQPPPPAPVQPPDQQDQQDQKPNSSLGNLAPVLLASLLGLGAGAGIPWLLGAYNRSNEPGITLDDTASEVEAVQLWRPDDT